MSMRLWHILFPLNDSTTRQLQFHSCYKTHHRVVEHTVCCHRMKSASILADRYRRVAVEAHGLQFMIRNHRHPGIQFR